MDVNVPSGDVELLPEKIEDKEEGSPSFHCDLYDKEIVHKIAQVFLPGLATACVDNTTGDIFRTPGTVAVDIRTEMVHYLTQRSESFVAESVILEGSEGEVSDHPYDIISDFVDDFSSLKRNLFSRVSGWLLSEKREDKMDDFAQEMEISGFWSMDRREAIAQTLLKNVDFKNTFHCDLKFHSEGELNEHVPNCGFRSMNCMNEGCNAIFSARQMEKHDSVCPFKIIPCEQKCSETLMRREMDRHCITVCPMKLVNCPFYAVGCKSPIPQCLIQQHRQDDLHSHLLCILQGIHKEASLEDLEKRVDQLKELSFGKFMEAPDVRSLTFAVRNLEAKLGPLEVKIVNKVSEEGKDNEKGEVNEEGKAHEGDKARSRGEVNEGRKANDNGTINEVGKHNERGKANEQEKLNEEKIIESSEANGSNESGKANEEGNINEGDKGGKVDEEGKVNEGDKINGGGKVDEEGKVNEGKVSGKSMETVNSETHAAKEAETQI